MSLHKSLPRTLWTFGQPCPSLTSSSPADGISRSVTAPIPPPRSGSPASSYHLSYLIISSCLSCPPLLSPVSFLHLFLSLTISTHLFSLSSSLTLMSTGSSPGLSLAPTPLSDHLCLPLLCLIIVFSTPVHSISLRPPLSTVSVSDHP